MPRQPRLEIPGIPVHVTQRGVNRCAVFLDDDDRQHYLKLLAASAQRHALQIHAYVLMGNHVHLLISSEKACALSKAMRQVGQNYVSTFNRRHRRTGTLGRSVIVRQQGRPRSKQKDESSAKRSG